MVGIVHLMILTMNAADGSSPLSKARFFFSNIPMGSKLAPVPTDEAKASTRNGERPHVTLTFFKNLK